MDVEKIVWVVDDHKLRREGIVGFLANWAAKSSVTLKQIERPEHVYPAELMPENCDLSQLCLLGVGGQSLAARKVENAIRWLRDVLDGRPLAIIGDQFDAGEIKLATQMGVRGLIPTYLDTEVAVRAIEFVMAGGTYFPTGKIFDSHLYELQGPQERNEVVGDKVNSPRAENREVSLDKPQDPKVALPDLSMRQREVLEALKRGLSNKMIARELNLSEATVKIHMRSLLQKFGAENRTQVALKANDPTLSRERATSARREGKPLPKTQTITH